MTRRHRGLPALAIGSLTLGTLAVWRLAAAMDGPWGMIPGGPFRSAESRPCAELGDPAELELELRPDAPRSITTWSVRLDGRLHVPADFLTPIKRWPAQVVAEPRVRIRADGKIHSCLAVRVTDAARIARLRAAIATKYALDPDGLAANTEVWWFELRPESAVQLAPMRPVL